MALSRYFPVSTSPQRMINKTGFINGKMHELVSYTHYENLGTAGNLVAASAGFCGSDLGIRYCATRASRHNI